LGNSSAAVVLAVLARVEIAPGAANRRIRARSGAAAARER
jgi:hypothetical protein